MDFQVSIDLFFRFQCVSLDRLNNCRECICHVQCSETHNTICIANTKILNQPTFIQTENPQALIRESVGIGLISRINNSIGINKVLFLATIFFFQQYIY